MPDLSYYISYTFIFSLYFTYLIWRYSPLLFANGASRKVI